MNNSVRKYLSEIGRRGGKKSRRKLSSIVAREMVWVREARRAFHRFYETCFWSFDPDYRITQKDVPWVAEELMKNGGREAWQTGAQLCR
jgi:hypothetical protein